MISSQDQQDLLKAVMIIKHHVEDQIRYEVDNTIFELKAAIIEQIKKAKTLSFLIKYDYKKLKAQQFAILVSEFLKVGVLVERTSKMCSEDYDIGMFDSDTRYFEADFIRVTLVN